MPIPIGEMTLEELQAELAITPEFLGDFQNTPEFAAREARLDELRTGDLNRALSLGSVQDEMLQAELGRIRQGPQATDRQRELIAAATEAALTTGRSDINRFRDLNLEALRDELAPSLGRERAQLPAVVPLQRVDDERVTVHGLVVVR